MARRNEEGNLVLRERRTVGKKDEGKKARDKK